MQNGGGGGGRNFMLLMIVDIRFADGGSRGLAHCLICSSVSAPG